MEHKTYVFATLAAAVIAGFLWFVFSNHPESYSAGTPLSNAVNTVGPSQVGVIPGATAYSNQQFGFSVQVPPGFTVDESYLNQDLGPGNEIPGVAFHIPASLASGTNLNPDSYVSIEELSDVDCGPSAFLPVTTAGAPVSIGKNQFASAESTSGAAGSSYDQVVYVTEKEDRCYAVRYFIHSGDIGNYSPGSVTAFDRTGLLSTFNTFASTLTLY